MCGFDFYQLCKNGCPVLSKSFSISMGKGAASAGTRQSRCPQPSITNKQIATGKAYKSINTNNPDVLNRSQRRDPGASRKDLTRARPVFKSSIWKNGPSPREIRTLKGHFEVNISNASGI